MGRQVYIMANVSASSAYATNVIAVQRFFYGQDWGAAYQFLLYVVIENRFPLRKGSLIKDVRVISTQILGFSFSGYLYHWLVRPASMIWPGTLVNTARMTFALTATMV